MLMNLNYNIKNKINKFEKYRNLQIKKNRRINNS